MSSKVSTNLDCDLKRRKPFFGPACIGHIRRIVKAGHLDDPSVTVNLIPKQRPITPKLHTFFLACHITSDYYKDWYHTPVLELQMMLQYVYDYV